MTYLTYEDLDLPHYRNSSDAITLRAQRLGQKDSPNGNKQENKASHGNGRQQENASLEEDIRISIKTEDVPKIAVLSGLNFLLVSDTGGGKTQLLIDISQHYFGGNVAQGGMGNKLMGRKDTQVDELFLEWRKEEQRYAVREDRIAALLNIVDELNRTVAFVQNDFFDLAEGERVIAGESRQLGKEGYALFAAAVNLNRINGEFQGTSEIDRALLSRARLNLDLDYYGITPKDEAEINASGKPKLKVAQPRDISDKILEVFHDIERQAAQPQPYLDAYLMLLGAGLRYCEKDELKRKRRDWPMNCGDCSLAKKETCSSVKGFEPRTTQTIKRFVAGIEHFVKLRYGDVVMDPFDLVFEAAKFTAYHGNLNGQELLTKWKGDDQHMMNATLGKIKNAVKGIGEYLQYSIHDALHGEFISEFLALEGKAKNGQKTRKIIPFTVDVEKSIEEKRKAKEIHIEATRKVDPFAMLEKEGIGSEGLKSYLKVLAEKMQKPLAAPLQANS